MPPVAEPAETRDSPGRERLKNLALAGGVSLALIVLVEGAARLTEASGPRPRAAEQWAPGGDDHFYTLKPRPLGWPPEEVNAEGVRDVDHPLEHPEDVWRVAILGDSVTEGFGLPVEEAFPRVLQRRLRAAGERIEVMSVALQGWSTRQQRIAYHRIVRRYSPDQVLLAVCLNDVTELAFQLRPPPRLLLALHRRSALVRRVVDAGHREERRVEQLFAGTPPLDTFFAEAARLRDEVVRDGAELALVVLPYRFQLEPGAPQPSVQAAIGSWCEEQAVRCLDLLPALRPYGKAAFVDENHLSREGSAASAQAVRALLPSRSMADVLRRELSAAAPATAGAAVLRWLDAGLTELDAPQRRLVRDGLLHAMRSPSAPTRAAATWAVGRLAPGPELEEPLRRALGDPSAAVAIAAARSLREAYASGPTTAALFAALGDPRQGVRWAAADALGSFAASPAWVPALRSALGSSDPYVSNFAAWTIGRIGAADAESARELLQLIAATDHDAAALAGAARQLGAGLDAVLPDVLDGLAHGDDAQRARAARTLGLVEARAAVPALTRALGDADAAVRAQAALALARIGAPAAGVGPLRAALRDRDAWVRQEAARALGLLAAPDPELTRELLALLSDPDPGVRRQAARALGRLSPPTRAVLDALERLKADDDDHVRLEAWHALEALEAAPR